MSDFPHFSRQQLCTLIGVDTILVGSWLRDDLLRSVDLEERKHRRFTRAEIILGAFLREARKAQLNISAMRALSVKIRESINLYDKWPFSLEVVDDAQTIHSGVDLQSGQLWKETDEHFWNVKLLVSKFPFDRRKDWRIGWSLWHGTGLLMLWQSSDGEWQVEDSFPQDGRLPAASVTIFEVDRFAAIDWSQAGPAL